MKEDTVNINLLLADWILEQSYFGLIVIDNEFKIIEINDWVLEKKKLKKQQVISKNLFDVFPEIKERKLDYFVKDALVGVHSLLSNKIHKYFIRVPIGINSDLEYEQHRTEISPLMKDDKIFGVLIRIEDVTERVINEIKIQKSIDELRQANITAKINLEKFYSLAEHIPALVMRFDKNLNIEYINKYIKLFTNIEKEKLLHKNISELQLPEDLKTIFRKKLEETLNTKQKSELKFSFKFKDKELKFFANSIPEFDSAGEIQSILVVCRDITQEENAIEKLEMYNRELEKLNSNKDRLFSIIAHDLRSPFNYLLNVVEVLDESFDELPAEDIKRYLREFKLTTKNIYNLLENLLTWAHLQRGTIQIKISSFNLKKFIESSLLIFEKIASKKNISFEINVNENTLIDADPDLLTIVLRNLISNALKFTPSGGKIFIESSENENEVELSLTDTGTGMTEEKIKDLFKIEKVKSEKGTEGEKGSGLGLILIKEIVDMHKGLINVSSKVGEGTTIKVKFPKVKSDTVK